MTSFTYLSDQPHTLSLGLLGTGDLHVSIVVVYSGIICMWYSSLLEVLIR